MSHLLTRISNTIAIIVLLAWVFILLTVVTGISHPISILIFLACENGISSNCAELPLKLENQTCIGDCWAVVVARVPDPIAVLILLAGVGDAQAVVLGAGRLNAVEGDV